MGIGAAVALVALTAATGAAGQTGDHRWSLQDRRPRSTRSRPSFCPRASTRRYNPDINAFFTTKTTDQRRGHGVVPGTRLPRHRYPGQGRRCVAPAPAGQDRHGRTTSPETRSGGVATSRASGSTQRSSRPPKCHDVQRQPATGQRAPTRQAQAVQREVHQAGHVQVLLRRAPRHGRDRRGQAGRQADRRRPSRTPRLRSRRSRLTSRRPRRWRRPSCRRDTISLGKSTPGGVELYDMFPSSLTVNAGTTVTFQMSKNTFEDHTATFGDTSTLKALAKGFHRNQLPVPGRLSQRPARHDHGVADQPRERLRQHRRAGPGFGDGSDPAVEPDQVHRKPGRITSSV